MSDETRQLGVTEATPAVRASAREAIQRNIKSWHVEGHLLKTGPYVLARFNFATDADLLGVLLDDYQRMSKELDRIDKGRPE